MDALNCVCACHESRSGTRQRSPGAGRVGPIPRSGQALSSAALPPGAPLGLMGAPAGLLHTCICNLLDRHCNPKAIRFPGLGMHCTTRLFYNS